MSFTGSARRPAHVQAVSGQVRPARAQRGRRSNGRRDSRRTQAGQWTAWGQPVESRGTACAQPCAQAVDIYAVGLWISSVTCDGVIPTMCRAVTPVGCGKRRPQHRLSGGLRFGIGTATLQTWTTATGPTIRTHRRGTTMAGWSLVRRRMRYGNADQPRSRTGQRPAIPPTRTPAPTLATPPTLATRRAGHRQGVTTRHPGTRPRWGVHRATKRPIGGQPTRQRRTGGHRPTRRRRPTPSRALRQPPTWPTRIPATLFPQTPTLVIDVPPHQEPESHPDPGLTRTLQSRSLRPGADRRPGDPAVGPRAPADLQDGIRDGARTPGRTPD